MWSSKSRIGIKLSSENLYNFLRQSGTKCNTFPKWNTFFFENCTIYTIFNAIFRPPRSFTKLCRHKFYQRVNNQYCLNWDEKSDDGNFVKQNCKSLLRYVAKPSNANHQSFFDLLGLMLVYQTEKRPSTRTCMRHHIFDDLTRIKYRTRKSNRTRNSLRRSFLNWTQLLDTKAARC